LCTVAVQWREVPWLPTVQPDSDENVPDHPLLSRHVAFPFFEANIMNVRRAVVLSLAQRYVAFTIHFGASLVLARLLTPTEVGIFSLAAAVVGIAHLIRDFGVGEYIIQERDLTRDRQRAAFGVTLIMAWIIAALIYLFAPKIAAFYATEGIAAALYVLALNFMLLPFGSTTFAVLSKEMAFNAIFAVQTVSIVSSTAVTLVLAYRGHSYMSLAWGSVVGIVVTIIMLALLRPRDIFILPSFKGLARVGRFGGVLTIGRLLDQICRRAPDLLIGNGLGLHAVGIFSKASSLLDAFHDFFIAAIHRVALPAFAQNRIEALAARVDYLKAVQLLAIFPLAFFGFLGLFAEPLIYLLFGPNWLEVAPLLRIMSIGGVLSAPYVLAYPALTANGRVRDLLRAQLVGGAILLPMIWFASYMNLQAVAVAVVIGGTAKLVLFQYGLSTCFNLRLVELLRSVVPSAIPVAIAGLASAPALFVYDQSYSGAALTLALGAALALAAGGVSLFAIRHPLAAELRRLVAQLTSGGRRAVGSE
jgi:O-antigen/teichoic acid export membrane protein